MAAHQPRPPYSPFNEEQDDDPQNPNGCGCFRLFCFGFDRNADHEAKNLLLREEGSWIVRKLKRVKEVSEMVAGPKWKTFIRKMGGYFKGRKQRNRFQYDPQSYALNFDGGFEGEDDGQPLGFSARFAVPMAAKEQH